MNRLITTSNATYPIGLATQARLFTIKTGQYAERKVCVYQDDTAAIQLVWADAPYADWSPPTELAADSKDMPCDCCMLSDGSLLLIYTGVSASELLFREVAFTDGAWTPGSAVTLNGDDICEYPSIAALDSGIVSVAYSKTDGADVYITEIGSYDGGQTWGVTTGEELTEAGTSGYSKVIIANDLIFVFYTLSGSRLAYKSKSYQASLFGSETDLASGSGFDQHFNVSASPDGRIGVVYDDGQMKFREHDGAEWLGVQTIDANGGESPTIVYANATPFVIFRQTVDSGQIRSAYITRQSGSFTTAQPLNRSQQAFEAVILYGASTGTYADLTAESESTNAADVYHPDSTSMLSDSGDAIYFGSLTPFRYIKALLSNSGIGGAVDWQYFNGADWVSFAPDDGVTDFSNTDIQLSLWRDSNSAPVDWQKTLIDGHSLYWVRARVTSSYTTPPVGSQLTGIPNTIALGIARS